jgi:hypothetical protein
VLLAGHLGVQKTWLAAQEKRSQMELPLGGQLVLGQTALAGRPVAAGGVPPMRAAAAVAAEGVPPVQVAATAALGPAGVDRAWGAWRLVCRCRWCMA